MSDAPGEASSAEHLSWPPSTVTLAPSVDAAASLFERAAERLYAPGAVAIARLAGVDDDYLTPGLKLQIEIDGVEIATWKYAVDRMPTGYLQNVRLTVPSPSVSSEVDKGVCLGEAAAPDAGVTHPNDAWVAAKLAELNATCTAPPPPPCNLNAMANGYTCGERIDWLKNNQGLTDEQARDQVADEFPFECGACAATAPTQT